MLAVHLLGVLVALSRGQRVSVLVDPVSSNDTFAAAQLCEYLNQVESCSALVSWPTPAPDADLIVAVGYNATLLLAPSVASRLSSSTLGEEGYVACVDNMTNAVGLSGSFMSPRGSIYAVFDFLNATGFSIWSENATTIPSSLDIPATYCTAFVPLLQYRETFNHPFIVVNDYNFSIAMHDNRQDDGKAGGGIQYANPPGFVHTAYTLVPPSVYNASQPMWFGGQQLCWSNDSLIAFLIDQVVFYLLQNPEATIISVSQNDDTDYCTRPLEQQIIDEEGSPAGPMLRTVNAIAAAIQTSFPGVAVDTLAYQYTLQPPNITKPSENVIIRLCSIECNFAVPFTHPHNSFFLSALQGWSSITDRLYVWDYVVNFANYVMPWPNWYVLGPNIRTMIEYNVVGVFEEGDYTSLGGDMEELKSWLISQLLWDPTQDDRVLIARFLKGYYGNAAPYLQNYLDLFAESVANQSWYMTIFDSYDAAYLTPAVMLQSALIFQNAAEAVEEPYLFRVQVSELPTIYVILLRWDEIYSYAVNASIAWPYPRGLEWTFSWFSAVYQAKTGWQSGLSEDGNDLAWLQAQIGLG